MIRPAALAIALALTATTAAAHDFWIAPSSFRPDAGSALSLRLRVGDDRDGDPVPRNPKLIERFLLAGPDGEQAVDGPPGADPAGYVRLGGPGLYLVGYQSGRSRHDLSAEQFEQVLAEEGLEHVSVLRRSRGDSARRSTEVFSRSAKALLAVGGEAGAGFGRLLGLPLELVPEANPYQLEAGGELALRLLFRGQPLEGALVEAFRLPERQVRLAARSGADGRVRLRMPGGGGRWLVKAVHMVPAPPETAVDWESFWASLTFELR